jgi:ligand-binding SRPBCC domain-containing protein
MAHYFHCEQFVPRPVDEVFEFFSRAENLQELTPPWLNFRILSVDPSPVRRGTTIKYSLRWRMVAIRWTSEIVEWQPPFRFVDEQRKGPYQRWHHEHRFISQGKGTVIEDEVQYELPFGALGRLAHRLRVEKDVKAIFAYRQKAIRKRFGDAE